MDNKEKDNLDDFEKPTDFIGSLPYSVQGRVSKYSEERHETGKVLVALLKEEARALVLYDAIYDDVDAVHDLSNPVLSRTIRACIDHAGRVPDGADKDTLLRECPQVLEAIESAFQKNAQSIYKR